MHVNCVSELPTQCAELTLAILLDLANWNCALPFHNNKSCQYRGRGMSTYNFSKNFAGTSESAFNASRCQNCFWCQNNHNSGPIPFNSSYPPATVVYYKLKKIVQCFKKLDCFGPLQSQNFFWEFEFWKQFNQNGRNVADQADISYLSSTSFCPIPMNSNILHRYAIS